MTDETTRRMMGTILREMRSIRQSFERIEEALEAASEGTMIEASASEEDEIIPAPRQFTLDEEIPAAPAASSSSPPPLSDIFLLEEAVDPTPSTPSLDELTVASEPPRERRSAESETPSSPAADRFDLSTDDLEALFGLKKP